ncbi:MAG: PAS domain-containing protein [Methylobacterium frigidaeris]
MFADEVASRLLGLGAWQPEHGFPVGQCARSIHEDDRSEVLSRFREALGKAGDVVAEYRARHNDGAVRRVLVQGRFYHDFHGRPRRSHGIILDVSGDDRPGSSARAGPAGTGTHPLERVADHCLAARALVAGTAEARLLQLLDGMLMETGRSLARELRRQGRQGDGDGTASPSG